MNPSLKKNNKNKFGLTKSKKKYKNKNIYIYKRLKTNKLEKYIKQKKAYKHKHKIKNLTTKKIWLNIKQNIKTKKK